MKARAIQTVQVIERGQLKSCTARAGCWLRICRGSTQLDLLGGKVLARGLHQIKIAHVGHAASREALSGACRRADGIIGHRLGRAGNLGFDVPCLARSPGPRPSGGAVR